MRQLYFLQLSWRWLALALCFTWLTTGSPPAVAVSERPHPIELGFHTAHTDSAHLAAARAAGGHFVVVVFSWRDIEPAPGYFYWEQPDAALRAAHFHGLQVVARLDRPPAWSEDDEGPAPWRTDAYAEFVRQVAGRYGDRLAGIILWNEPNLSLEWHNRRPDAAGYVALLRAAYPAAKAAAPTLPVLMAGLAFTEGDRVHAVNDLDYLQAIYAAGGGAYFDTLAAHPYGFGRAPEEPPSTGRLNFRRIELHRAILEANGDGGKPVWITEMGWRSRAVAPEDAWQVVTAEQQAQYVQRALAYAETQYPWLERMALWELNAGVDHYGYALWQGPERTTPAYESLVARCRTLESCPVPMGQAVDPAATVEILAADAPIRLGDIGTLHPHWVHLYRGGGLASRTWQGEFFLSERQADQEGWLVLETMQVDQPTNRVSINGVEIGRLAPRPRPDPTSTWTTQQLQVPADLLRPGANSLEIASGLRNPVRQYSDWRWENFQFRNVRMSFETPPEAEPQARWEPLPWPAGWVETVHLRPGATQDSGAVDLWLTGNRAGQIWRFRQNRDGTLTQPHVQAANRPGAIFLDVAATPAHELAATDRGLLWRPAGQTTWRPSQSAPAAHAYVVLPAGDQVYAGFEGMGLWVAPSAAGPWQRSALPADTVIDLASVDDGATLYAATADGVYRGTADGWRKLASLPDFSGETERRPDQFVTRLTLGQGGELVVRHQDRLWRWEEAGGWKTFGPSHLQGALHGVVGCCRPGAEVTTHGQGIWRLGIDGSWARTDDGFFDSMRVTDLLHVGDTAYGLASTGLFVRAGSRAHWQPMGGFSPTITDLLIDPARPAHWVASTPVGIYASRDHGTSWRLTSPPWDVWDMAFGPGGRLFVARSQGVAWTDDAFADPPVWHDSASLESVTFFKVAPSPVDPDRMWAGAWGNDIGVSIDGGRTLTSLRSGLETLSILDILWHATPGQFTVATIEGLYRSDDGGQSWFKLPGPLGHQTVYALAQTDDGTLLAGAADGLWRSQDYGVTWQAAAELSSRPVLRLGRVDGLADEPLLWAGAEAGGAWWSRDQGATWQFGGLAGHTVYSLVWQPATGLVAATEGGLFAGR